MSKYSQLKNYCKSKKIKVKEVSSRTLSDFAGINDEVARKFGFRKMKDKSIFIDKNMKSDTKYRTLKHELVEMNLMEKKRYPYWKAHRIATRAEGR
jgi:hypothetical protein